jgi:hypothetical protein
MAPANVEGLYMLKSEVVINYNSMMQEVDLSDTYLASCCSTRKYLKNYQKYF